MGASASMQPEELADFRKLNTAVESVEIPARPESRSLTDRKGFIICGVFIIAFLPFLIYTLIKSDISRVTNGFDDCGNICGVHNQKIDGIGCSGRDYTNMPYSTYTNIDFLFEEDFVNRNRYCRNIPYSIARNDMELYDNFRIREENAPKSKSAEVTMEAALKYCRSSWWKFIFVIAITTGLCLVTMLLLRYFPAIIIWGVLIFTILVAIILTCFLWYGYISLEAKEEKAPILIPAIIASIVTVVGIALLIALFKKIGLVIMLYKEATKAVFALPVLLLVPVFIAIIQLIVLGLFFTTTAWMLTAADLQPTRSQGNIRTYQFVRNGVMTFSMIFNLIVTGWTMQLLAGIQVMIIAGSVGSWYFSKNKQYMESPIGTSICNALKFHVGTVALGSFILILVAVIKALIQSLLKNEQAKRIFECCFSNLETFLKYLSKNAYIETAIQGQSFLRSGKRAAKLLITNASSVIAINSVGDFVLEMIVLLLLIISTAISYGIFSGNDYAWFPTVISLFINIFIVGISFGIFETTIDTLFICFCEDKVINDGLSKPYCMSRGLMEFVESSKIMYPEKTN